MKYFVRCRSQDNQNITLKIKAESEDAARDIAFNTYRVKEVWNVSKEEKVEHGWSARKERYHVIERKGKYLRVFC